MEENNNQGRKILRNKMISFMYLIFIVLAFLYIPSDFIDTIRDINTSFEISSREMNEVKNYNMLMVKAGLKADSLKNETNQHINFKQISFLSDSVYHELELIKQEVHNVSGGFNKHGFLKNAKDNQFTDKIMLELGKAKELRKMLIGYKTSLVQYDRSIDAMLLDSIIPTQEIITTSTGKKQSWEKFYFYKMPLTVSLALIAKFQNDIRRIESMVMEDYLAELNKKYDLALLEKNLKPEEKKPEVENNPKVIDPEAYIKNSEMNVLYMDINNPLEIYHPRFNNTDITAEITKGEVYKKDDLYYARVNNEGIVVVNAYSKNDKTLLATQKFMAKSLPDPSAFMGDRKGGYISSKIFKIQKNVTVRNEILNDSEGYTVKNFSLIRISGSAEIQKSENNQGAFFNSNTRELIDQAKRGDLFIFDNIEVEVPRGNIKNIPSLVFTII